MYTNTARVYSYMGINISNNSQTNTSMFDYSLMYLAVLFAVHLP